MISPFMTTNSFMINFAMLLLTTSITGGFVTGIWLAAERLLEKKMKVNTIYRLMKWTSIVYFLPVVYILSKFLNIGIEEFFPFLSVDQLVFGAKVFLTVWVFGAVLMIMRVIHNTYVWKKFDRDEMTCAENVKESYRKAAELLGIEGNEERKLPLLIQSNEVTTPCMIGIRHPAIILPAKEYSKEELEVIFVHQLNHCKQGDMMLNGMLKLLLTLHFFNPLAWLWTQKVRIWSECACDYRSCGEVGGAKHYFTVILNISKDHAVQNDSSIHWKQGSHTLTERVRRMTVMYGKKC